MNKKNLLITGGAGFIGTNFIRSLLKARPDWLVVNLDALTYAGSILNVRCLTSEFSERCRFIHGDVRNVPVLDRLFAEQDFGGVVHFAAESHVDRSVLNPETFVTTNVVGTFCLLEASLKQWRFRGEKPEFRFVHVSTDEVYGSLGPTGYFTEETSYDPSSPYSASKAASDHFVKAYFRTYGLPTVVTNCSNNFGPFQFPEKLIPLMILNMVDEIALPVYGDGRNVRDWIYVNDHCQALLNVLEGGKPGETYNIGGGAEKENIEIVEILCELLDKRMGRLGEHSFRNLIRFVKDRPGHDRRYAVDSSKIQRELGWYPKTSFEEALGTTIEWYLENMVWVDSIRSGEYRNWIQVNYGDRT
jgi:dTDP-glucose 4,6-dehydratase